MFTDYRTLMSKVDVQSFVMANGPSFVGTFEVENTKNHEMMLHLITSDDNYLVVSDDNS